MIRSFIFLHLILFFFFFFLMIRPPPRSTPFPTRRSSDLRRVRFRTLGCYPLSGAIESGATSVEEIIDEMLLSRSSERQDRKSTRLNSSHQIISYAVFCLKKKKKKKQKKIHNQTNSSEKTS